MTRFVLDASFLVKLLVDEAGSAECRATVDRYPDAEFLVPAHADAEVLEVLLRKARARQVTPDQLDAAVAALPRLADPVPLAELTAPALAVARRLGVSMYDALYVALADAWGAVLLTADIRLVERLRGTPFADLALGFAEGRIVYFGEGGPLA
jgi:predicted nucleic acid-binding protein